MSVSTQYATETADGAGEAVFVFPDVPRGETWIGTVTIPEAPASAAGVIMVGGSPVGPLFGPGVYGPYIADASRLLSISVRGLTPDAQFVAVWHADDKGERYTTWPGTVTTTVEGTVVIPTPVDVTVVAPDPLPVSGIVTFGPTLATTAPGGSVAMTGSPVGLPSHAATNGVVLRAPAANAQPLTVNGFTLDPGAETPLLPVDNSDRFSATGTSGDNLSFLVT